MIRRAAIACGLAVAALLLAGVAVGDDNPHLKPESCESCHAKVPTSEDIARNETFLIAGSIDATCHGCHEDGCCKIANLSLHIEHPTNVNSWDRTKFQAPRTVPLFGGYITCLTCHYHLKPEGESFQMVRLARKNGERIEWMHLCRDCHVNY